MLEGMVAAGMHSSRVSVDAVTSERPLADSLQEVASCNSLIFNPHCGTVHSSGKLPINCVREKLAERTLRLLGVDKQ